MDKISLLVVAVILTLGVSIAGVVLPKQVVIDQFGNATASYWDTAEGYKVDGTTVIDGSGGITGTTATLSSTLAVTGATTLSGDAYVSDVIVNGGVYTTTTATTTIGADIICDYSVWSLTSGASVLPAFTWTMPASSSLAADCLDTVGDVKSILVINASTAASTTIFAEGVGTDFLVSPSSIATTTLAVGEQGWLTFIRSTTGTTTMIFEAMSNAD